MYFLNEVLKWGIELMWVIQSDYCKPKLGFPWFAYYIKYIYIYIFKFLLVPHNYHRYHRNLKPGGFSTTPLRCWKLELPPSWPPIIEGNVWMWRIYPGWWRRAIDSCFTGRDSVVPLRGFWDGYFFCGWCNLCWFILLIHICIHPAFFPKGAVFWNLKRGWYIYIYIYIHIHRHPLSSIQRPGDFRLEPPRLQGGVGFLRSRKWILKTPKINSATKVLKQPQKGTKGNDFCEL